MAKAAAVVRAESVDRVGATRKAARVQQRTSYARQGAAEALATAKARQPGIVKAPAFRPLSLLSGQRLLGFDGDFAARISGAGPDGNHNALRVSPIPLRVRDGEDVKPVDLSLRDDGDSFSPTAALEPLRIAKDASAGLSFGGGFSLAPAGQAGVTGTLTGSSVFYANVATDTDFVVHPDPTGAETHFLLRSQTVRAT